MDATCNFAVSRLDVGRIGDLQRDVSTRPRAVDARATGSDELVEGAPRRARGLADRLGELLDRGPGDTAILKQFQPMPVLPALWLVVTGQQRVCAAVLAQ